MEDDDGGGDDDDKVDVTIVMITML